MDKTMNFTSSKSDKKSPQSSAKNSDIIYAIDYKDNGIEISRKLISLDKDPRDELALKFPYFSTNQNFNRRTRSYSINGSVNASLDKLESKLQRLSKKGILSKTKFRYGLNYDPLHPFKDKFDFSMKLFKLIKKYKPGMVIIQTRSPLIVLALDSLKDLGRNVAVNFAIETCSDEVSQRLCPELPKASERLRAVSTLKRFGVEVGIQVYPLLPYGGYNKDAQKFAEILVNHSDHIFVKSFFNGDEVNRYHLSNLLTESLIKNWGKCWLKENAAIRLINEIKKIAPEKLECPERKHLEDRQLKMFA